MNPEMSENWAKYGLELVSLSDVGYRYLLINAPVLFTPEYTAMVQRCHDAVACYLDSHPEEAALWRQPGHRYYDILAKAAPEWATEVSEWSKKYLEKKIGDISHL